MTQRSISSWDDTPKPSRPLHPRMPRDIPPALAQLIISYACVIVRLPPERLELAVRAMEAEVSRARAPVVEIAGGE